MPIPPTLTLIAQTAEIKAASRSMNSMNFNKYHSIACQYCGLVLERDLSVKKATCFDCKAAIHLIDMHLVRILRKRDKLQAISSQPENK